MMLLLTTHTLYNSANYTASGVIIVDNLDQADQPTANRNFNYPDLRRAQHALRMQDKTYLDSYSTAHKNKP